MKAEKRRVVPEHEAKAPDSPRRASRHHPVGFFIWETQHRKILVDFKMPPCLLRLSYVGVKRKI